MTDPDQFLRADAARWNATRPPALQLEDQFTAALAAPPRTRPVIRPLLAIAAVLAVVLALTAVGILRHRTSSSAVTQLAPITGVVWRDPTTNGTVVYTRTTIRVDDGCSNTLAKLTVHGRQLSQGTPIGPDSVCSGHFAISEFQKLYQQRVQRFDDIVTGPATWTRHGTTLTLRKPGTGTLTLTTNESPAPEATGPSWRLSEYVTTGSQSHRYHGTATLHITHAGRYEATGTCSGIDGTAVVAPDTIRFTQTNTPTCPGPKTGAVDVLEHLLTETAQYSIANTTLVLSDSDGRLLIYDLEK